MRRRDGASAAASVAPPIPEPMMMTSGRVMAGVPGLGWQGLSRDSRLGRGVKGHGLVHVDREIDHCCLRCLKTSWLSRTSSVLNLLISSFFCRSRAIRSKIVSREVNYSEARRCSTFKKSLNSFLTLLRFSLARPYRF